MQPFQTRQVGDQPTSPEIAPPSATPPTPPDGRWQGIKEFYRANKWYVWAIAVGVVIIAVLGYFAFRSRPIAPAQQANVSVSIDGPQIATSGGEVIYKIKAENQDKVKLVKLELELVYPDGVNYVSSTPRAENLSGTLFAVPDLDPGQNAVVIVKATAQGNINDQKQLTARLHYHYSNINSEYTKEATTTLRLVASDIGLDVTGPQTTTNAQPASYDVSYINNSDHDINNSRLEIIYPDGFSYTGSTPQPNLAKNIWNIGTLKRGDSGKVSFQGMFKSAQPGQSQTFTVNFLVQDAQGNYNIQASNSYTTAISTLPLLISQTLENPATGIAKPGDTLNYSIKYQNTAAVAATGVNIILTLDPKSLDLSTIEAQGGEVNNNTITWNAAGVSNLENLNPNDSGQLRFSVRIKDPAVKDSSKNVSILTTIKVKSNEYQTYLPGNDLSVKVSSPAGLKGSAKPVSGALPLHVGQSTTMQVTVSLTNSTDDFSNSVLTGFIPAGTTYDPASVNGGESKNVSYDPSTGKVTWKVGTLAAHLGDFNPARSLSFNVRVNPAASQVGQNVVLFRNISFNGKDTFTSQDINLQAPDVTSSDLPDGLNNGRVQS
jgi:hypothetical protein